MREEVLWVEKYRPQTLEDCILPKNIKTSLIESLKTEKLINMLFYGLPGTGKTTLAKAICNELDCEYLMINASKDNGIDVLRTRISEFASTRSMDGKSKVVILDEADYLSDSFQPALRGLIEEFSKTCRFILTCNHKIRIIDALKSRLAEIDFNQKGNVRNKLCNDFLNRLVDILEKENVKYESKDFLAKVIIKFYPDFRKTINEIQKHTSDGILSDAILFEKDLKIKKCVEYLKHKKWGDMREWVVSIVDDDLSGIYRNFYDTLVPLVKEDSIINLIYLISSYQRDEHRVLDKEIHLVAFLSEVMQNINFKD